MKVPLLTLLVWNCQVKKLTLSYTVDLPKLELLCLSSWCFNGKEDDSTIEDNWILRHSSLKMESSI